MSGGDHFRVIGQTQVIVGAEIQYFPGVSVGPDVDGRLLGACDQSLLFEKSFGFQCFGLLGERREKGFWHGDFPGSKGLELYRESGAIPMPGTVLMSYYRGLLNGVIA